MPVKINWPLAVATVTPNVGGWIGGYCARRNITWYESLKKPSWTPPSWAFGPTWTAMYCTIGYSSYLVWRDGGGFEGATLPLATYGINIILNWAWTPLFFETHNIKWSLYEVAALWINTMAVGITFYDVNPTAGYLTIPYLTWTTFAATINYFIYRDNKQPPADAKAVEEKKIKDVTFT